MGNLVLAGATSGSTTITPSATGTYTITLPAETGTIQTSGAGFTTNGVAYASSTSALTTGSNLTYNGTVLTINGTASNQTNFIVTATSSDLFRFQPQASGTGVYLQATNNAQSAYAPMGFYATSYAFNVGNVGIGTTSPSYLVEAKGSSAAIGITGTGTVSNNIAISNTNTSSALYIGQDNSTGNNFNTGVAYGPVLWTNASSQTFVTNSGNHIIKFNSGNIGVDATLASFVYQTIQFPGQVTFGCNLYQASMGQNLYYAAGWKYIAASQAGAIFTIDSGQFNWTTTGSGTGSAGGAASTTQPMTLDPSGNLLLGTTSQIANGKLNVNFTGGSGSYRGITLYSNSTAGTAMLCCTNANGIVGEIITTGSSTAYNTSSDYRLKNTIAPMTGALAKVSQLKPVTYKWNADGSDSQGFIAHELQEIVPECVTGEKDGTREEEYEVTPAVKDEEGNITTPAVMGTRIVPVYQGIDTSFLVATLTSAIQELSTLITAQQSTIQSLTERITALEGART